MSEIKFRAWDKIINEWVYFTLEELCNEVGDFSIMKNWCQYTGLKDKNGREIYDRDIVVPTEMHDENIDFYSNGKGVPREIVTNEWGHNVPYDIGNWEVIGNIYENKELLEGK